MKIKKHIKRNYGAIVTILLLIAIVSLLSLILSLLAVDGEVAKIVNGSIQTSLITIKNIISIDGLSYLFNNTITNFNLLGPLSLIVLSMISIGIFQSSGLLYHLSRPLKKVDPNVILFITVFISCIFTLFGDYSFIVLFPLIGVIYKNIGMNPLIGVTCVFLGVTTCYGTGIIYNYNYYLMGNATELSASLEIDTSYQFNLLSNFYIMVSSSAIISFILSRLIKYRILNKYKKIEKDEIEYETNDSALWKTNLISLILMGLLIYCIVPGLPFSGLLLDKTGETYIAMLLGSNSPFYQGFMFIILIFIMILSYIYGKKSGNIKNTLDYNDKLSTEFSEIGHIFVLLFFSIILIEIIEWTNIANVIVANLISLVNGLQFSGLLLVAVSFIIMILMGIILPDTLTKWSMMSPLIVPLFMKSNITPEFTQFIFSVADGIGKALSPFYIYFFVYLGFLQKYNKNNVNEITYRGTIKRNISTILIISAIWLLLLVLWYVVGIPLGIGTSIII